MTNYPHLLEPLKVGRFTYKHRMVAAPIYCGTFSGMDPLYKVLIKSVTEKAEGGCASVTIGETPVDFEYASREPFVPIDYTDYNCSAMEWFKKAVGVIHDNGAVALIELSHCGESKLAIAGAGNAIGPMSYVREDGVVVEAMDDAQMQMVIDRFITAARFMREAGFDGVMVHSGHGWLLSQFLSARTNRRTDEYGGSLENRARFPLRLIRAMRAAFGPEFLLEVRLSGSERIEGGMEIDEVAEYAKMLEPYIDLLHISVGLYRDPVLGGQFSSMYQPHGLNADMARKVKEVVSIPVTVVGGVNSPALAQRLIAQGKCDLVAMARQLTADPNFPKKAIEGREDDITPCLRCYKCFPGPLEDVLDDLINLYGCSVNPEAFIYESEWLTGTAQKRKSVLIVGGGIAGMQAALTAAQRGHSVTLVEKSDRLGGVLGFADNDAWKTDLRDFKDLMIRRVERTPNIEVRLNTRFTQGDVADFGAEEVIIAVGSTPVTPPIDGIEHAVQALDAYADTGAVGQEVVIVGGGLVGCELGLSLAKVGRRVTVVEMEEGFAPDAYPMHKWAMADRLFRMLTLKTAHKVSKIRADGVSAIDKDGKLVEFPADTVIYALGMKGSAQEAARLALAAKHAQIVGDCAHVSKVYDAVHDAFHAAMRI